MAESSSGGAASKGRAAQLVTKKGKLRKGTVGGAAGIPFKSGFRTARGQKAFTARGGKNVSTVTGKERKAAAAARAKAPKSKTQAKKAKKK